MAKMSKISKESLIGYADEQRGKATWLPFCVPSRRMRAVLAAMVWATDAGFDARAQAFRLATADAVVKASREQRGWGDNLFGC